MNREVVRAIAEHLMALTGQHYRVSSFESDERGFFCVLSSVSRVDYVLTLKNGEAPRGLLAIGVRRGAQAVETRMEVVAERHRIEAFLRSPGEVVGVMVGQRRGVFFSSGGG